MFGLALIALSVACGALVLAQSAAPAAPGLDPAALLNPPADSWPTYHGDYTGRRHSRLTQITPDNVHQLTVAWTFQTGAGAGIKASPILVNGVIYLTMPDNIWAIDKGSDMVVKFNPDGHVAMVFGRKKEASDLEAEPWERNKNPPLPPIDGNFRQPTDVAWNAAGDIFISDGYVNSRVAKYDKNGDWVKSFGEPGSGPGQLNTPHSIAIDAKGNVYVANRGNVRIEVFDSDGKYLRQIKLDVPVPADARPAIGNRLAANATPGTQSPGAPWAVCITPGPNQVLYAADAFPGRIYKLTLDGKILGVLGKAGKQPKQFGWVHEIACPSENELYVAEILNWRVQKLQLHPERSTK